MKKTFGILLFMFLPFSVILGTSYKVMNLDQFNEKSKLLLPGDSIILSNGVWKDAQLVFKGNGEKNKYIYLLAENSGKVSLEGESCLRMSGNWLYVSGLVFRNGHTPRKTVIEFRTGSKEYAFNSVLAECVVDQFNQKVKDSTDHWIALYGQKNTIRNCYFAGKTNLGTTLIVCPDDENSINNQHLIYRNYFGFRPRLGSNGGETIRIGTSEVCTNSSETIVKGNYFEHCSGETEIISNKSTDNSFLNNTFYECEGSLVLRHGNNATVAGNWFIGNGKAFTGGIRVINEGHKIFNNYFYRLAGDDFRSSLAIMNGIPNSPANGYAPVKNVIVANNTYYDCTSPWSFGVGFGFRNRIAKPENTLLLNNLVYCPNTNELIKYYDQTDGIMLDNNILVNSKGNMEMKGTVKGEIFQSKMNDLEIVYTNTAAKRLAFIKEDILGQVRTTPVIGAFQNNIVNPTIAMATKHNCGPEWYRNKITETTKTEKRFGKATVVEAGLDLLSKAVKNAGDNDTLLLMPGEHVVTKKMAINQNLVIRSADNKVKPIIIMKADKENAYMFEISNNVKLQLEGVKIDGNSESNFPTKYAFISSREGAAHFSLIVNQCEISGFNVKTGSIYRAYKGSYADSIVVTNTVMKDCFRGFSLSEEKDDKGTYNAEIVKFENSVFDNFTQHALDYYRGGNDESTLGGFLFVNHCVFNNIGQDEKQSMLKLNGIVNVSIANSIFSNSMAKTSVKLSGNKNIIQNCCFYNCPAPKVKNGAVSQNLYFDNPRFEKKSFLLSKKSPLIGKATDGGNIGLR